MPEDPRSSSKDFDVVLSNADSLSDAVCHSPANALVSALGVEATKAPHPPSFHFVVPPLSLNDDAGVAARRGGEGMCPTPIST